MPKNDDNTLDDDYKRGLRLARAGDYFSAHEAFEAAWRDAGPDERDFFQGLVHAVVFAYQTRPRPRDRRGAPAAEGAPPARAVRGRSTGASTSRGCSRRYRLPSPTFANTWSSAIRSHQSRWKNSSSPSATRVTPEATRIAW